MVIFYALTFLLKGGGGRKEGEKTPLKANLTYLLLTEITTVKSVIFHYMITAV